MKPKSLLIIFLGLFIASTQTQVAYAQTHQENSQHGSGVGEENAVTIKLNQPRMAVCGRPFFNAFYNLTKETFINGAEKVVLSDFENKVFSLIRSSEQYKDNAEMMIDHIKAIPGQIIDIVKEDPEVLDSCENFSIAMSGPQH